MANGQEPINTQEYQLIKSMVEEYNLGLQPLTDPDAEKLARYAAKYNLPFKVQERPFAKGFFDFADMASFGLIPNKWRPTGRGEMYHGEATGDKIAGGIGSLFGLATGVGAGIKGGKALYSMMKGSGSAGGGASSILSRVKSTEAAKRSQKFAQNIYNKGDNIIGLGSNPYRIDFSNLRMIP